MSILVLYATAAVFIYTDNNFGLGTGIVLIEYISCNGNELSISGCTTYNYNYNDRNSAGLRCENYPINEGKSQAIQSSNFMMYSPPPIPNTSLCLCDTSLV